MSTKRSSNESTKTDVEGLFDGAIEPSGQAYVDVILKSNEIDLTAISIQSYQEQSYSETKETYALTFHHTVRYKGEAIWKIETNSHNDEDGIGGYTTSCNLSPDGRLEVIMERKGNKRKGNKRILNERRLYDIRSLIRGSAMAYQMRGAEEEINLQYTILNKESLAAESFSSYLAEVSDGSDASEGGTIPNKFKNTNMEWLTGISNELRAAAPTSVAPPSSEVAAPVGTKANIFKNAHMEWLTGISSEPRAAAPTTVAPPISEVAAPVGTKANISKNTHMEWLTGISTEPRAAAPTTVAPPISEVAAPVSSRSTDPLLFVEVSDGRSNPVQTGANLSGVTIADARGAPNLLSEGHVRPYLSLRRPIFSWRAARPSGSCSPSRIPQCRVKTRGAIRCNANKGGKSDQMSNQMSDLTSQGSIVYISAWLNENFNDNSLAASSETSQRSPNGSIQDDASSCDLAEELEAERLSYFGFFDLTQFLS
jgi:hypothetical protein